MLEKFKAYTNLKEVLNSSIEVKGYELYYATNLVSPTSGVQYYLKKIVEKSDRSHKESKIIQFQVTKTKPSHPLPEIGIHFVSAEKIKLPESKFEVQFHNLDGGPIGGNGSTIHLGDAD